MEPSRPKLDSDVDAGVDIGIDGRATSVESHTGHAEVLDVTGPQSEWDSAHLLANRLVRDCQLANELLAGMREVSYAPAASSSLIPPETHSLYFGILQLVSPLLHNELEDSHRGIDPSESIALALTRSLLQIWEQSQWDVNRVRKPICLNILAPMYLATGSGRMATGSGRMGSSLAEALVLAREYTLLTELDRLLGATFSSWFSEMLTVVAEPIQGLNVDLRCQWSRTSKIFWNAGHTDRAGLAVRGPCLENHSLTTSRRAAFWSIVQQWIADQEHVVIPTELGLGVVPWPALRSHWMLIEASLRQESAAPSSSFTHCESTSPDETADSQDSEHGERVPRDRMSHAPESTSERWLTACQQLIDVSLEEFESEHAQVVEIRSANDPQLVQALNQQLVRCRADQGLIALAVVRELKRTQTGTGPGLTVWQKSVLRHVRNYAESTELRGFVTADGELALMLSDLDRSAAVQLIRDALQNAAVAHIPKTGLVAAEKLDIVAGIGSVSAPARSFCIEQLTAAAWRCLEGASTQGSGTVKTIEVF